LLDGDDVVLDEDETKASTLFQKTLTERDILHTAVMKTGYLKCDLHIFLVSQAFAEFSAVAAKFEFKENKRDDNVNAFAKLKAEKNKWIAQLGQLMQDVKDLELSESNCIDFNNLKYIRRVFIHSFVYQRGARTAVRNWKLLCKEKNDLHADIPLAILKLDAVVQFFNERQAKVC
jgi:hypothetical protein